MESKHAKKERRKIDQGNGYMRGVFRGVGLEILYALTW